jgi:hypothetical protein
MTLLVNSTKKHSLMRKGMPGTGASLPFKHSNTKIKGLVGPGLAKQQFLSPPVVGKGSGLAS